MTLNSVSRQNLQHYADHPNDYILCVRQKEGNELSVDLMKKGVITWIKIHIGGLLGLFDTTTVKIDHISKLLGNLQEDLPKKFTDAYKLKDKNFKQLDVKDSKNVPKPMDPIKAEPIKSNAILYVETDVINLRKIKAELDTLNNDFLDTMCTHENLRKLNHGPTYLHGIIGTLHLNVFKPLSDDSDECKRKVEEGQGLIAEIRKKLEEIYPALLRDQAIFRKHGKQEFLLDQSIITIERECPNIKKPAKIDETHPLERATSTRLYNDEYMPKVKAFNEAKERFIQQRKDETEYLRGAMALRKAFESIQQYVKCAGRFDGVDRLGLQEKAIKNANEMLQSVKGLLVEDMKNPAFGIKPQKMLEVFSKMELK